MKRIWKNSETKHCTDSSFIDSCFIDLIPYIFHDIVRIGSTKNTYFYYFWLSVRRGGYENASTQYPSVSRTPSSGGSSLNLRSSGRIKRQHKRLRYNASSPTHHPKIQTLVNIQKAAQPNWQGCFSQIYWETCRTFELDVPYSTNPDSPWLT